MHRTTATVTVDEDNAAQNPAVINSGPAMALGKIWVEPRHLLVSQPVQVALPSSASSRSLSQIEPLRSLGPKPKRYQAELHAPDGHDRRGIYGSFPRPTHPPKASRRQSWLVYRSVFGACLCQAPHYLHVRTGQSLTICACIHSTWAAFPDAAPRSRQAGTMCSGYNLRCCRRHPQGFADIWKVGRGRAFG